jgi:anti-sigma regulatory factor (Ser/Thr protein kinase)
VGASRIWSEERVWRGAPGDVSEARQFVAEHLRGRGLGSVVDDARLLVSELATNAVTHGGTAFSVTLTRCDELVQITVADGAPMPAHASSRPAPHDVSGRGLPIVEHLSSDWGVATRTDGGKCVWATLQV